MLCGPGVSGEFEVNVDLIQGSAVNPLLFIVVLELITERLVQKTYYGNNVTQRTVVHDGEADTLGWEEA